MVTFDILLELIGFGTLLFIASLPIATKEKVDKKILEYEEVNNDLDKRIRALENENEELCARITKCEETILNFEIKNQPH